MGFDGSMVAVVNNDEGAYLDKWVVDGGTMDMLWWIREVRQK